MKTGKVLSNRTNKRTGRIYWSLPGSYQQAARWIAITFPELVQNEYFEGAEIDHIIPLSVGGTNHPSNLRWVTRSGNMRNSVTQERCRQIQTGKKATEETRKKMSMAKAGTQLNRPDQSYPTLQYSLSGEFIKRYPSAAQASRDTGVPKSSIKKYCNGKRKTPPGGYIWAYEKREP